MNNILYLLQRREIGYQLTPSSKCRIFENQPYICCRPVYISVQETPSPPTRRTVQINPMDFYRYNQVDINRTGEVISVVQAELQRKKLQLCYGDFVTLNLCNHEFRKAYRGKHSSIIDEFFRYHWNLFYDEKEQMFITIRNNMVPKEFSISEDISPWHFGFHIRQNYYFPIDLDFFQNVICNKDRIRLLQRINPLRNSLDFFIAYKYRNFPGDPWLYILFDEIMAEGREIEIATNDMLFSIYNWNIREMERQIRHENVVPFLSMVLSQSQNAELAAIGFASPDRLIPLTRKEDGIMWKEYPVILFDVD